MEGFFVLDSEIGELGENMKGERMEKKSSVVSIVRKRLSDITNSQQRPKLPSQDEMQRPVLPTTKDYIEQLRKENMALVRVLGERNKIIEMSGLELQKLRINMQKMQQQNWQLAQANSQILAELNLGKDRLKALQHELGCKIALLKAKNLEVEGNATKKTCQTTGTEEGIIASEDAAGKSSEVAKADNKPCSNVNRRRQSRSQSMGPSTMNVGIAAKEKVENKRPCLRRQSARFKSQPECSEDLFEIEDAKFPVHSQPDEPVNEVGPTSVGPPNRKEEREVTGISRNDSQELRRLSVGRPLRRAAEKVQSYKETPLNLKMRRSE